MTLLLAALLTLVGDVTPPMRSRVTTAATLERIALGRPPGSVTMEIDPLAARLILHAQRDPAGLAATIARGSGRLCRDVHVLGGAVVAQCETRRIDAALNVGAGKLFLEIHELRGLPWRGETERLSFHYDNVVLGMGPCPGITAAQRGECALKQGRLAEAALEFRKALDNDGKTLAALRLGDIAVSQGDVRTAAGWYQIAGMSGIFGRLAQARLCELGGGCLDESRPHVFDELGAPEPVRSELQLRAARVAAYAGRVGEMLRLVQSVLARRGATGACDDIGAAFCRRLLLFALEQPGGDGGVDAIETYLQLPHRIEGPLWLPLVRAAAEKSVAVRAPVFGGNLLAASAAMVRPADLPDHLLRAAELYLMGGDRTRARVIAEYADARLGRKTLVGARWTTVFAQARHLGDEPPAPAIDFETLVTQGTADVAAAFGAMARARSEQK